MKLSIELDEREREVFAAQMRTIRNRFHRWSREDYSQSEAVQARDPEEMKLNAALFDRLYVLARPGRG